MANQYYYKLLTILILTMIISGCETDSEVYSELHAAMQQGKIEEVLGFGNLGVHSTGVPQALELITSEWEAGREIPGDSIMFFLSSMARDPEVDNDQLIRILQELIANDHNFYVHAEGATATLSCTGNGRETILPFEMEFLRLLKENGITVSRLSLDSPLTFIYGWRGESGESNCPRVLPRDEIKITDPIDDIEAYVEAAREIFPDVEFTITYPIAYKYFAESNYGMDPNDNTEIYPDLVEQVRLLQQRGINPTIEFDMPYQVFQNYENEIIADILRFHRAFPQTGIAYVVNSQPWGAELTTEQLVEQSHIMYRRLAELVAAGRLPQPDAIHIYSWTPNLTHEAVLELAREIFPDGEGYKAMPLR